MNAEAAKALSVYRYRFLRWLLGIALFPITAWACPLCDSETGQQVRDGIFGADFGTTLLTVIAPFPVLLLIVAAIALWFTALWEKRGSFAASGSRGKQSDMNNGINDKPLVTAGTVLGIGLGGFVDGILFHQLLQTHNMLSAKLPKTSIRNIEINMVWDGLFHTLTWVTTVVGLALLWRAGRRNDVPWSGKAFVGALFLGWGLFNFIEGVIDHHILHIHHVMERYGQSGYDYAFLASGIIFIVGGWMAIRSARSDYPRLHAPRGAL